MEGSHTFSVRARDAAGNIDPSPSSYSWNIDLTVPNTSIDSAPDAESRDRNPSSFFHFSSTEPNATFECSLNEAPWALCGDFGPLNDGDYRLAVRARDAAGNVDDTPATYSWKVDATAPAIPLFQEPAPTKQFSTPSPVFSGTAEHDTTVTLFIDGVEAGTLQADERGAWRGHLDAPLPWGQHRLSAKAKDTAGNTSDLSPETPFSIVKPGHYGMDCSAAPSTWQASWPWALLLLGLLRRRSRPAP